jgi:hypothetical protein
VLHPSPLERNLALRFTRGRREHMKMMKDTLTVEHRGFQDNWTEENFLVSHVTFPSMRAGGKAPCRIWWFLMTIPGLRFVMRSSCPDSFIKCSRSKITSWSSDVEGGHLPSEYKLLDRNELWACPEMTLSWIIEHDGYTKSCVRS